MGDLKLLDCTLRDGGYINDWDFGTDAIVDMTKRLITTNVDILELGFMKNEPYQTNRTVFNSMEQVKALIGKKRPDMQYAVMIEVLNPPPLEMIAPADEDSADIIRVIVWKRLLEEGFEYCKGIVEKGYKLCVQPARVDQYSHEEFADMVRLFDQLNPMAIYVVDSWGTQYAPALLEYMHIVDKNASADVAIGYHGHNNMMQAFDVAREFSNQPIERDMIIDASIYGIGRGAGNLNLELFAKYLNETRNRNYELAPMIEIYDLYLDKIYNECKWGYSLSYFLSAVYNCNPNYASYYDLDLHLPMTEIHRAIATIPAEERIIYTQEKADMYLAQSRG